MVTTTRERIEAALHPLLRDGETLRHSACGAKAPSTGLLLLGVLVVPIALAIGIFAAQLAITVGLIQPGPLMPVVAVPIVGLFLVPYFVALLRAGGAYGVGVTDRRLLVADLQSGKSRVPAGAYSLVDDATRLTVARGLVPGITIAHGEACSTLRFGLGIPDNREQGAAIVQAATQK